MPSFQSITGALTTIDSEGNSEGSFTAYAFMKKAFTQVHSVNEAVIGEFCKNTVKRQQENANLIIFQMKIKNGN